MAENEKKISQEFITNVKKYSFLSYLAHFFFPAVVLNPNR